MSEFDDNIPTRPGIVPITGAEAHLYDVAHLLAAAGRQFAETARLFGQLSPLQRELAATQLRSILAAVSDAVTDVEHELQERLSVP